MTRRVQDRSRDVRREVEGSNVRKQKQAHHHFCCRAIQVSAGGFARAADEQPHEGMGDDGEGQSHEQADHVGHEIGPGRHAREGQLLCEFYAKAKR